MQEQIPGSVGEFDLLNPEKTRRALYGEVNSDGEQKGGVASSDGSYSDEALLAEYDRLGGLIKKGGDKVRTGSFFDFKAKRPRKEPAIEFVFRVNGKEIFVPEGKELPGIVKAARMLEQEDAEEIVEEAPKKKRGRK